MSSPKIEAPLLEILQNGKTTKVIISMSDKTEDVLQAFENREFADRTDKLNAMNKELTTLAETSHKAVIELLDKEQERIPVTWNRLWMSNQLIVDGVDLTLVEAIAAIENVEKIDGETFMQLL